MKTLTRLCLVICMAAITAPAAYAGRPQCADMTRPGICFDDDTNYPLDVFIEADPVTTSAYALIWEGNDFARVAPDGSTWWHATDAQATLYVCPVEGVLPGPPGTLPTGLGRCMLEWVTSPNFPEPTPEMWVGESLFTFAINFADYYFTVSCPSMLHSRGTAVDPNGQSYRVTGDVAWIKTPGQEQGCTLMFKEIEFTAQ